MPITETDGIHRPTANGAEAPEIAGAEGHDLAVGINGVEVDNKVGRRCQVTGIPEPTIRLAAMVNDRDSDTSFREKPEVIDDGPHSERIVHRRHTTVKGPLRQRVDEKDLRLLTNDGGEKTVNALTRRTDPDLAVVSGTRKTEAPEPRSNELRRLLSRDRDGRERRDRDPSEAVAVERGTDRLPENGGFPGLGLTGNDGDAARPREVRNALVRNGMRRIKKQKVKERDPDDVWESHRLTIGSPLYPSERLREVGLVE